MTRGRRAQRYAEYRALVTKLTNEHGLRRAGFTIDHIVPISVGMNQGIPAELIGSRENLRLLTLEENVDKGARMTEESLVILRGWGYEHIAEKFESRATRKTT